MSLTVTDLFAGAGGSSTGMVAVPGVEIRIAANHWQLAIDVHNQNHPTTDHAAVDLHQEDPRFFPRTDVLWASPECTKWSQANGSKPLPSIEEGLFEDPLSDEATRRSRLLMFDVLRFIEHHRYRLVMIENVVDIATQTKYQLAWEVWRQELVKLGYTHRVVSLNSMHAQTFGAPAPQSRDRIYICCWPLGEPAPDFEQILRPRAYCPRCDQMVESQQAWKPGKTVGRYRQSYAYIHGICGTVVEPGWLPAAAAIDWSLPGERIGDRLKAKTRARIAAGIARYWGPIQLEAAGNTYDATDQRHPAYGQPDAYYRAWPLIEELRTLHATASKALAIPVEGRDGHPARHTTPSEEALRTLTANGGNMSLLTPYYSRSDSAQPVDEPIGTLTAVDRYALVQRMNTGGAEMTTPAAEFMRTLTAAGHQALIQAGPRGGRPKVSAADLRAAEEMVPECLFRMFRPHEVAAGMAFPADYDWDVRDAKGKPPSNRDLVKMAGSAVTPPSSRDLMHVAVESLGGVA